MLCFAGSTGSCSCHKEQQGTMQLLYLHFNLWQLFELAVELQQKEHPAYCHLFHWKMRKAPFPYYKNKSQSSYFFPIQFSYHLYPNCVLGLIMRGFTLIIWFEGCIDLKADLKGLWRWITIPCQNGMMASGVQWPEGLNGNPIGFSGKRDFPRKKVDGEGFRLISHLGLKCHKFLLTQLAHRGRKQNDLIFSWGNLR